MLGIKAVADGVLIHDQLSSLDLITLPKKLDGAKFISIFVPRTIYHVETFHSLRLDIIKTEETINEVLKKIYFDRQHQRTQALTTLREKESGANS